jgi:hypothetical protein
MSFLRTESFSSSFGTGIGAFMDANWPKSMIFNSKIFPFLVIKTLDSDPDLDLDMDPEPDPH